MADIAAATLGTILIALGVLVVAAVYGGVVCRGPLDRRARRLDRRRRGLTARFGWS